jgi:hypothetical protein
VAEGTPEKVAEDPASHTGRYLKPKLAIDQKIMGRMAAGGGGSQKK